MLSLTNYPRNGRKRLCTSFLIFTLVFYSFPQQVLAQSMSLPYGATWYGIQSNEIKKTGESIFLCWGWNASNEIQYFDIQIRHMEGFKDNTNCKILNFGDVIYSKTVSCAEYSNDDIKQLCDDISLCPRTGLFQISVTIGLKKKGRSNCPRGILTVDWRFTILPASEIPIPLETPVTMICPNRTDTYVEISSDPTNQNGGDWYNSITCVPGEPGTNIPERFDTYRYPISLGQGQTKTIYPAYFKKYELSLKKIRIDHSQNSTTTVYCTAHSLRVPQVILGLQLGALQSPTPIFRLVCDDRPIDFLIENPLGLYDGAKWYEQTSGAAPVHDGFEYTRKFPNTYTLLYTTYYKNHGGNCEDESLVKSRVIVVNMQSLTEQAIASGAGKVVSQNKTITDYRDVDKDIGCASTGDENKYWINLESDDIVAVQTDLQTALQGVLNSIPLPPSIVKAEVILDDVYWRAANVTTGDWEESNIYLTQGSKKIVCSDFICKEGESKTRRYEKRAKIIIRYSYRDPLTGDVINGSDEQCAERLLAIVMVKSIHPQETPIDLCVNLDLEGLSRYFDTDEMLKNCDGVRLFSACPATQYSIGPTDQEVLAMYTAKGGLVMPPLVTNTHSWNPKEGLSNPNAQNPTIWYQDIKTIKGNFALYSDAIKYFDNKSANYCTVIYKCDGCGLIDINDFIDDTIIPNP